jgi:hypothetical protein
MPEKGMLVRHVSMLVLRVSCKRIEKKKKVEIPYRHISHTHDAFRTPIRIDSLCLCFFLEHMFILSSPLHSSSTFSIHSNFIPATAKALPTKHCSSSLSSNSLMHSSSSNVSRIVALSLSSSSSKSSITRSKPM